MARTPLSKNMTYGTLTTNVRNEARITTTGYSLITDAIIRSLILLSVQRVARILTNNEKPFYRMQESLSLIGLDNPYYVDTSQINPYWNKNVRLVHVTSSNVRTPINVAMPQTSEELARLENVQAQTINAIQLGWGFRIFFGSGITVTPSTDVIEFTFDSQASNANASGDYLDVPDSLVPFIKDEVVEYILRYKGLLPQETFERLKTERIKNVSAI